MRPGSLAHGAGHARGVPASPRVAAAGCLSWRGRRCVHDRPWAAATAGGISSHRPKVRLGRDPPERSRGTPRAPGSPRRGSSGRSYGGGEWHSPPSPCQPCPVCPICVFWDRQGHDSTKNNAPTCEYAGKRMVEVAGIEPASSGVAIGLLRAQPASDCRGWHFCRRQCHPVTNEGVLSVQLV